MTRKYSLLIEGDESGYSAHVPELPTILVTGKSIDELRGRAVEAIQLWLNSKPTRYFTPLRVQLRTKALPCSPCSEHKVT
jgi:predicted RNase H-like HicB family nuclease